jgi:hypothetical protein
MANQSTAGWESFETMFNDPSISFADIAAASGKSINAVHKKHQRLMEEGKIALLDETTRSEMVLSADLKDMRGMLATRDKEIVRLERELDVARRIDAGVRRPPEWMLKARSGGTRVGTIVAQLTDTHFDEVVKPEEVGYINAYNREIQEQRLRRWVEKVIVLSTDYVSGVDIDGLFIPATGDLLSGDIHHELRESNADILYASADHWIDQLISAIKVLAGEFNKVHIGAVVGNHGRSTIKPVFKGRAKSNIEWLMWRQIARYFADDDRVTVQVADGMDLPVRVYDTTYLLTHGDQFRGGSGISGAMAPLMLGQHRKAMRQTATSEPMDIMVMGHFHQYLTLPGLIVGGSMKGYDEYAYGLNLRPEPARQAFWVTSPEHGPTITAPVFLQDRDEEGW